MEALASGSYAWVLYAYMAIVELERLERPFEQLRDVHRAQDVAKAFNQHELLWQEEHRLRAAIFAGPSRDRVQEIMDEVAKYSFKRVIRGD